jgi:hypothetical protein
MREGMEGEIRGMIPGIGQLKHLNCRNTVWGPMSPQWWDNLEKHAENTRLRPTPTPSHNPG